MKIYDQVVDERVKAFLMTAPRYKLVVVRKRVDLSEEKAVNVGRELAERISCLDRSQGLTFEFGVGEAISDIIKSHTFEDADFGQCVVLDNVGILFEKALKINVCELLKKISKNTLVILLWPGKITNERLYFLTEESGLSISQTEINYTTIL